MLWVLVQAFSLAAYYQDGADGLVAVRPVEAIALDGPHRQWTVEPGDELLVVRRLGRTAVAQLTVLPPNHRWSDPPNRVLVSIGPSQDALVVRTGDYLEQALDHLRTLDEKQLLRAKILGWRDGKADQRLSKTLPTRPEAYAFDAFYSSDRESKLQVLRKGAAATDDPRLRREIAVILALSGRWKKAASQLSQIPSSKGMEFDKLVRAISAFETGMIKDAKAGFESCLKSGNPACRSEAALGLARVSWASGRIETALFWYGRASQEKEGGNDARAEIEATWILSHQSDSSVESLRQSVGQPLGRGGLILKLVDARRAVSAGHYENAVSLVKAWRNQTRLDRRSNVLSDHILQAAREERDLNASPSFDEWRNEVGIDWVFTSLPREVKQPHE